MADQLMIQNADTASATQRLGVLHPMEGTFTNANHFDGGFTASYSGGRNGYDCTDPSWTFKASR